MLACAAPEILVAEIAAATSRIRVGSGGVMLPHYSPFKVAEAFSVLGGLHGKRIDLGIGRAPGSDLETIVRAPARPPPAPARRLPASRSPSCSPTSRTASRPTTRSRGSRGCPARPGRAEVWLLGSSPESAVWAAELGPPLLRRRLHQPGQRSRGRLYRDRFVPSRRLQQPELSVAVGVVCAETDEEAERLSSSWRMAIMLSGRGQFGPLPAVTRALAFLAGGDAATRSRGRRVVVGSPETVRAALEQIAAEYGADE